MNMRRLLITAEPPEEIPPNVYSEFYRRHQALLRSDKRRFACIVLCIFVAFTALNAALIAADLGGVAAYSIPCSMAFVALSVSGAAWRTQRALSADMDRLSASHLQSLSARVDSARPQFLIISAPSNAPQTTA
jgi:hypothetical protein